MKHGLQVKATVPGSLCFSRSSHLWWTWPLAPNMILGMSQASENSRRHWPRGGSLLDTQTAPAMPTPFCEGALCPEGSTREISTGIRRSSKARDLQLGNKACL